MKKTLLAVGLAVVALFALVAWKPTDIQGQRAFSAVGIACSADDKIVYAADLNNVLKSEDGGKSWTNITPK